MDLSEDEVYAYIHELQNCGCDVCDDTLGLFTEDELAMADVARAIALLV